MLVTGLTLVSEFSHVDLEALSQDALIVLEVLSYGALLVLEERGRRILSFRYLGALRTASFTCLVAWRGAG